ncbi:MAG: hypothetical protein EBR62_00825 [Verrucomicrobia bacterium]|jgi:hypothetical protein|nr:hypothetical protein [Verrucomicrobiota bacterium]
MNRSTLIFGLLIMCGAAYLASKIFAPLPVAQPSARVPVTPRAEPAPQVVRPRPAPVAAPVVAKKSEESAVLETRFRELREEGRVIRETLNKTEPKAAQAYENVGKNPDYQALVARRHLLENSWGQASDAEKQSIVNEVNAIRQQTVGMVLMELARLNSQPAQPVAQPNAAAPQAQRGNAAPQPAPPPPIIYM